MANNMANSAMSCFLVCAERGAAGGLSLPGRSSTAVSRESRTLREPIHRSIGNRVHREASKMSHVKATENLKHLEQGDAAWYAVGNSAVLQGCQEAIRVLYSLSPDVSV